MIAKELELKSRECKLCKMSITGIEGEGFLWPTFMKKDNCAKFPPHGPRIFNMKDETCWLCAIKKGETWHR